MALELQNLSGKVAIVTGGGRGVGRGIAQVLAEAGARIAMTARTVEQLDASVSEICGKGGQAIAIPGDATSLEDAQRTVNATLDAYGRIDIMINNVGGAHYAPSFLDFTEQHFLDDYRLNVISAFNFTKLVAPHMKKIGKGSVINISSRASAGYCGVNLMTYSITKQALEQFTRMAARGLAPDIRVNAISLGTIEATWSNEERMPPEARQKVMAQLPLGRMGTPEDIGLAALYLCNDNCYASGSVINVDGGIYKGIDH